MCACGKTVNGLRVTLAQKVNGYWDHGAKNVFNLEIWEKAKHDSKGYFQRIECWEANHWFSPNITYRTNSK